MMSYSFEGLRAENERLREEIRWLRNELERFHNSLNPQHTPMPVSAGARKKGEGAHYDVGRLSYKHRQLLFGLLSIGATSEESAVPVRYLRRKFRLSTGPTAGRMAELIRKGFVMCTKVKIKMQPNQDGTLSYRPECEIDPRLGIKKYKRFCYWITEEGKRGLYESVRESDDFIKAIPELRDLAKLKKSIK